MFRKFIVFIVVISFASCYHASYNTSLGSKGALDFSQGRWVLNDATCENCDNDALEEMLMGFLKDCAKDAIVDIHQERQKNLITSKIPFEPSEKELKLLHEGTDASYLITVEGKVIKSEFTGMGYENDNPLADDDNIAEVSIAFYDLKTQTQIHYINTRGSVSISKDEDDDDPDFVFAPTSYKILTKSMKKNIKKLKKNCKCK